MLVDLTRCISCRSCSRACQISNQLPEDPFTIRPESVEVLTYKKWSALNTISVNNPGADPVRRGVKRQCMHCLEPSCVGVCPVGAMEQSEAGPVIYHSSRCIGCRYCMVACPFDVPKFEWESGLKPVIGKCQFCLRERLVKGQPPACVDACPTGALKFGNRQDLLFEAHARIRAHGAKYVDHVFGENEVGGTS